MIFNPYGIIISLAILAGTLWTAREFKKAGEDPRRVWAALPWVVIFGVSGARLYHVLHYWGYYAQDFVKILAVWHGGLGIYGGLLGGGLGLIIYNLKSKISNLKSVPLNYRFAIIDFRSIAGWLNLAAPGLALGQAIGRVGNIVNGEILPYAIYEMGWDLVIFVFLTKRRHSDPRGRTQGSLRGGIFEILDAAFGLTRMTETNMRHPGKLSASRIYTINADPSIEPACPVGRLGMTVNKLLSGSRFTLYLFLYALGRFFLEFSRTDNVWRLEMLSVAQVISLLIVVVIVTRRILESRTPRLQAPGAPARIDTRSVSGRLATGGQAQNDGIS